MPTINQLRHKDRLKKKKKIKPFLLKTYPQRKGQCEATAIMSPKKPNSAKRKVAIIIFLNRLSKNQRFCLRWKNKKTNLKYRRRLKMICYIPGEGHNLKRFSNVLIQGGRTRDLPGVKYKIIRGKYDLLGVFGRSKGRSKYGTKKRV